MLELFQVSKTRWWEFPLLLMLKIYGVEAYFHPKYDEHYVIISDTDPSGWF